MADHNELGQWGEEVAVTYLLRMGYFIRERGWNSGHRDIDIIAVDEDVLVFIEVKTRRNRLFGEPEEAVNYKKMYNLRRAINHYVKYMHTDQKIRLDIITVVGTPEGGTPEVTHIQDVSLY